MPPRRLLTPAFYIFLIAFAVRLLIVLRFAGSIHFLPEGDDMKFYADWAVRIANGQLTDHKAFYGLPGYAYCLAPIFWFARSFEKPDFIASVIAGSLQALMDAGIAALTYALARLVFSPRGKTPAGAISARMPDFIGIAAASAWIAYTPAATFSAVLMPTVWLVLAYYTCLWWAAKTQVSSWWSPWLGLGVFAGLFSMLVATILFAIPLFIASIILSVNRGQPMRARLPRIAAAVAVTLAGVCFGASPAWIHNRFVAGEPVMLSAHSGINFWIGNNPTATGYPKMPPGIRATQEGLLRDSITLAEQAVGHKMTRAEVSKFWSEQANRYIREKKFAWLRLMGVKFANFWNAYQYDDLSIIKLLRDDGIVPGGLRFGIIAALGLAGAIPAVRLYPRSGWIVAAVFLHMCALMPVFVTERYRLAAVPGLMILGSFGLWHLWEALLTRRWLSASGYALAAAGAAWFVSIPRPDPGLWSLDHYKAGIRSTTAGDLDRAQTSLETAYAYVSNNADINFALGNLWLEKSSRSADANMRAAYRTRAKLFYRLALDLKPTHAGTLNNLGVLAMEERRLDLAEQFFTASLATEPDDAKTYYLIARVRFESGNLAGARSALDRALTLRPNQKEFLQLREQLSQP